MKKMRLIGVLAFLTGVFLFGAGANVCTAASGKELFDKNCAKCHFGGGNVINKDFALHKKVRETHGVKTASDIVAKMRNPGPGMPAFNRELIPDSDAKKIAQYIIKTF